MIPTRSLIVFLTACQKQLQAKANPQKRPAAGDADRTTFRNPAKERAAAPKAPTPGKINALADATYICTHLVRQTQIAALFARYLNYPPKSRRDHQYSFGGRNN